MNTHATMVVDALGGTAAVARLCLVSMPSVSDWKKEGIPAARMQYLSAVHGGLLKGLDLTAATAKRRGQPTEQEPAHG